MPGIKRVSFNTFLQAVNIRHSFDGYDKDKRLASVYVADESPDHLFNVCVQSDGSGAVQKNITRHGIPDALRSLSFVTADSSWYETQIVDSENDGPGYLYLIRLKETSLCKIGISEDYRKRLKTFSVEFPIEIETLAVFQVRLMRNTEYVMHTSFMAYHRQGEWFGLGQTEIEQFLRDMDHFSAGRVV